jgi:hypothetical protein
MTSAPNRRWFRFSLRTLFVVVTLTACALPWIVNDLERIVFVAGVVLLCVAVGLGGAILFFGVFMGGCWFVGWLVRSTLPRTKSVCPPTVSGDQRGAVIAS